MFKMKEKNISQNQTCQELVRTEGQFSPARMELVICTLSPDFLKQIFLNTSFPSESALKTTGITRLLLPVLRLHLKRQTQGPKERFMVDKHVSKTPAEQNRCSSVE